MTSIDNKPSLKTAREMTIWRNQITCGFGKYLAEREMSLALFHDQSKLPHPKEVIFNAICLELMRDPDPKHQEALLCVIISLAEFQPDVGEEPFFKSQDDLAKEEKQEALAYLERQEIRSAKFDKLFEDDYKAMEAEAQKAIEIGRLMSPEIKKQLFGI